MATPLTGPSFSRGYFDRVSAHVRSRRANDRAVIENPLAHFTDAELQEDVKNFVERHLPSVAYDDLLRAARVGKDIRLYDEVARHQGDYDERAHQLVTLTEEEKKALRDEKDVTFSEKGMLVVIATVSLAAFLQGFVQSSFNGASLYKEHYGLTEKPHSMDVTSDDWKLGAANASPWFVAALVGCPLSLPINYWFGRRGGIGVAAFLILCSSIAAIFADSWTVLLGIRIVNGVGMGIKAVSTPILASETAVGFWRGSAILAWQLWVAFGIMISFAFNLLFTRASSTLTTFRLIQGAPLVPSLALLFMVMFVCPESPRYHLMKGPNYSVDKAFRVLRRVRNTELQALRDMYVVHKSIEYENMDLSELDPHVFKSPGFFWVIRDFWRQYVQLFQRRRLRNAVISASTVNLAQQLCGVNVCAFYSGTLFNRVGSDRVIAMTYSLGFGAINFFFALPAVKSIDTIGRRRWLIITLPFMAILMLGAAFAGFIEPIDIRIGITACFLFLFAAAYSPGLGPIPFTLASESFPLTHREAGTGWAISINFLFAGLLALFFPSINSKLGQKGSLSIFAGLNVVAFVMVFLLVEETKQRSLEELDHIFAVSKRKFIRFQTTSYVPWAVRRYIFGSLKERPELYRDLVWGSTVPDTRELKRTVIDPAYQTRTEHAENMGPWQSPVPTPKFSVLERPYAVELEESYPPGVRVPYPRRYNDGRSSTASMDNTALNNNRPPR
ncbi:hypothetical protein QQS21_011573 [Conoideocrella luteorostrata]|uniref:Major facilitator superfamily (MFS) profile domain-containing protein n=1 Tax=Conoideocrella luteorostrata TaxID=1105319 RepID=A0AAJ0FN94_9HYPO|nr:hypothetical protein QQS21_011573 [Conoideocrella luteorostrata]